MCFASGDVHPRSVAVGLFIDTCRQVLKCSCPDGDWFVFTSIESASLLLELSCSTCHFQATMCCERPFGPSFSREGQS